MVSQSVHVDVAMMAAGHNSVAMHQRYVNLKPGDVAKAFGIVVNCSLQRYQGFSRHKEESVGSDFSKSEGWVSG